ncbi:MAG: CAP domain-containing protein [Actinobacteria bacterium]|nr:CAP domain-containing protein [Actinomycetota bacterium]MCG2802856.1 CAP domain-containing protein [Cellulomonas sp.]
MSTQTTPRGPRTAVPLRHDGPLLDRVPTPRQADPTPPSTRPSRWRDRTATAAVAVLALAATGVLAAQNAQAVAQQKAATERVSRSAVTGRDDAAIAAVAPVAMAAGAQRAERAALSASAVAAVQDAAAVAAASPHAGDSLAPLAAASSTVQSTSGTGFSPAALRTQLTSLSAARGAVVGAEGAWQAAEQARIAAAQAAAAQAAAAQAASHAATRGTSSPRSVARASTGSSSTSTGASAAPSSSGSVHAVTLACLDTPPGSGSSASAGAVGAAINAYRSGLGLPALSVSTSGTLSSHALDMAASGGIWHSGSDNIVGCAPSATSLVGAWSRSPSHNAQMTRTDVSSMAVGAATAEGFLFSAVKFN